MSEPDSFPKGGSWAVVAVLEFHVQNCKTFYTMCHCHHDPFASWFVNENARLFEIRLPFGPWKTSGKHVLPEVRVVLHKVLGHTKQQRCGPVMQGPSWAEPTRNSANGFPQERVRAPEDYPRTFGA